MTRTISSITAFICGARGVVIDDDREAAIRGLFNRSRYLLALFFGVPAGGFRAGPFGAGVTLVLSGVLELVSTPPSFGDRSSPISTVCVSAVSLFPVTGGVAGAIVSVAWSPFSPACLRHPGSTNSSESTKATHSAFLLTFFHFSSRPDFSVECRPEMTDHTRIGIFGWGIVAPRSPNIDAFATNLDRAGSWLTPFRDFGPSNFLVGYPEFDFDEYRPWFDERFAPSKFAQLKEKMGPVVQFAIGSFIQSLTQNPGIEQYLQSLEERAHVYVGTGIGDITIQYEQSLRYDRAQRRWNEFWAAPERCAPLRNHLSGDVDPDAPINPSMLPIGTEDWIEAKYAWEAYWMRLSDELTKYLADAATIQGEPVPPSSGSAKLGSIRQKLNRIKALNRRWGCPEEPWSSVSPNLLWNIANIPASQVSMIGKITGPAQAPIAACASFGVALKMATNAIRLGEATAAVVGMTDPPPHPLILSGFYNANVLAADADVSRPLTGLKGTHVSGGSCVWIIGDADKMRAAGFKPVGLEIVTIGTSSDAHHIITPSKEGPQLAMRLAMKEIDPVNVATWDMHATATPGDATEIEHSMEVLHPDVLFTARKGTFGHGMAAGGGWELTAQHLGVSQGKLYPTLLTEGEMHADVTIHGPKVVQVDGGSVSSGYSGKLSMGIGGINACVISRPWSDDEK